MSFPLQSVYARIELVRSRGGRPVVLLDVDDTLLLTSHRHVRILREFAATLGPDRALAAKRLASIGPNSVFYSIVDTAKAAGVQSEALLSDLRRFWFERFFANEYLLEDREVPGAAAFCQEALVRGARLVYVTGRDESMREGTLKGLQAAGFPMPDGEVVHLILKPRFETPDWEFKVSALERVNELGTVVAGFENEPAHINLFQQTYPKAEMVFVATRHSGKPVHPNLGIAWIGDFLAERQADLQPVG